MANDDAGTSEKGCDGFVGLPIDAPYPKLGGGKGNDRLFGNKGDDVLLGRAGNDSHNCGPGQDDFANGGSGADTETNCESTRQIP